MGKQELIILFIPRDIDSSIWKTHAHTHRENRCGLPAHAIVPMLYVLSGESNLGSHTFFRTLTDFLHSYNLSILGWESPYYTFCFLFYRFKNWGKHCLSRSNFRDLQKKDLGLSELLYWAKAWSLRSGNAEIKWMYFAYRKAKKHTAVDRTLCM